MFVMEEQLTGGAFNGVSLRTCTLVTEEGPAMKNRGVLKTPKKLGDQQWQEKIELARAAREMGKRLREGRSPAFPPGRSGLPRT